MKVLVPANLFAVLGGYLMYFESLYEFMIPWYKIGSCLIHVPVRSLAQDSNSKYEIFIIIIILYCCGRAGAWEIAYRGGPCFAGKCGGVCKCG